MRCLNFFFFFPTDEVGTGKNKSRCQKGQSVAEVSIAHKKSRILFSIIDFLFPVLCSASERTRQMLCRWESMLFIFANRNLISHTVERKILLEYPR